MWRMYKAWNISGAFAALLAILLVSIQAVSAAHALEHGEDPHSHDGIPCSISILTDQDMEPVLPDNTSALVFARPASDQPVAEVTARCTTTLAHPSARAPPAN
ncbi:hypothetical protein [Parvularcula sp. IMCC14364]|uniref:hypothetical protein n=1 Tax=Parvularcula sp. IMCC14364 TaxID=3067902 RepID=UPI0027404058|nr:hypothetical protein [Parvularcula sp. IMCC14364]